MTAIVLSAASCKEKPEPEPDRSQVRKVFLLYADGYSNLTHYMKSDVAELALDSPMGDSRNEHALLVYEHFTENPKDYTTPKSPLLMEIHRTREGAVVRDTLKVYPKTTISSSAEAFREALEDVRSFYPNAGVGLCYSSHGTGWLPEEYYNTKETSDGGIIFDNASPSALQSRRDASMLHPFLEGDPLVKSIGCQGYYDNEGTIRTHEIEINDFASAIPYKLDYLILDACLMGGVETLYELRGTTDYIMSSCEEIYANGLYYEEMLDKVLYPATPNLVGVCDDYVNHSSSATYSIADCRKISEVADVCRSLFEKYRTQMEVVDPDTIQRYFTDHFGPRYWFYDMYDILDKSGASQEDLAKLQEVLDQCIIYKKATARAIGGYDITTHCGMSMYLPKLGDEELSAFYTHLAWNQATSLVK